MRNANVRKMRTTVGAGFLSLWLCAAVTSAQTQQPAKPAEKPEQPLATAPPIKTESRLVLVDAVVTDKKGKYLRDMKQEDFKVLEDGKEQVITSFAFGSSDAAIQANGQKHYLILFFDNSSMEAPDQIQARSAATKFIENSQGADSLMAVVDFGGSLVIKQNFTASGDLLKAAVTGVHTPNIETNPSASSQPVLVASGNLSSISNAEADYGARTMLLAVRSLAKNLRTVPGRKMLILFSAGFPLTTERTSELEATIDACNKANVAIYALDVRGLKTPLSMAAPKLRLRGSSPTAKTVAMATTAPTTRPASAKPRLLLASFSAAAEPQKPGGGGGGPSGPSGPGAGAGSGGGRPGGGSGGTGAGGTGGTGGTGGGKGGTGGTGGTGGGAGGAKGGTGTPGGGGGTRGGVPAGSTNSYGNYYNNPNSQPRNILPRLPDSVASNQQILQSLAEGTGGFAIYNTNDLLGGLQRIAQERNEFYVLGYVPQSTPEGSCHTLKVKVQRGGVDVRSRSGYCNVRAVNPLDGKPIEKQMELQAAGSQTGSIHGSMQAPYFYSAPNIARVNLSMEVPSESLTFNKDKGKYHANVNVLGIAYREDGTVGARFNDTLNLDLEKDEWKDFNKKPYVYQNQFDAGPGKYKLTVVFSAGGENFGKFETPLSIDTYDGKKIALGGVVLSNSLQPVDEIPAEVDSVLMEDRTPLIVKGIKVNPSASYKFKKSDNVILYSELYEPLLKADKPPVVAAGFRLFDTTSNKEVFFSNAIPLAEFVQKGNPVVPFGFKVPVKDLPPGSYRLALLAVDGANNQAAPRTIEFAVSN
jgi:VWFA-related protein